MTHTALQATEGGLLKVLGVVHNSALSVGDELLSINGQDVRGKVSVPGTAMPAGGWHKVLGMHD